MTGTFDDLGAKSGDLTSISGKERSISVIDLLEKREGDLGKESRHETRITSLPGVVRPRHETGYTPTKNDPSTTLGPSHRDRTLGGDEDPFLLRLLPHLRSLFSSVP